MPILAGANRDRNFCRGGCGRRWGLEAVRTSEQPLSAEKIYNEIIERGLYRFLARDPLHVVESQLRRHCDNLSFPSARRMKYFTRLDGGRYGKLLEALRSAEGFLEDLKPGGISGANRLEWHGWQEKQGATTGRWQACLTIACRMVKE